MACRSPGRPRYTGSASSPYRAESDRVYLRARGRRVPSTRHLKVTPDGDDAPWDPGLWAATFAGLAAQADNAAARLGIDFFRGRT